MWILVFIAVAVGTGGEGVTTGQIEFATQSLCQDAEKTLVKMDMKPPEFPVQRLFVRTECVQTKK